MMRFRGHPLTGCLTGLALAFAAMVPSAGAVEALLRLTENEDNVPTEAVHSWIELRGFTRGIENTVTFGGSTGGGAGTASQQVSTLSLDSDVAIASIMRAAAVGSDMELTLDVVRVADEKTTVVTRFIFHRVYFQSIKANADSNLARPVFDVEFQYVSMEWSLTYGSDQFGGDRVVSTGWDFAQNTLISPASKTIIPGDYDGLLAADGDMDKDGMLDAWEQINGLDPGDPADAGQNPDNDPFTNLEEFVAGTNPRSNSSFFRVSIAGPGSIAPGTVTLAWNTIPDRVYIVDSSDNPASGFSPITTINSTTTGVYTYEVPTGTPQFFRLRVSLATP